LANHAAAFAAVDARIEARALASASARGQRRRASALRGRWTPRASRIRAQCPLGRRLRASADDAIVAAIPAPP